MSASDLRFVAEVALVSILVALLTSLQRRYRLLQYVFLLRLPLFHALALLLLPLAVFTRAFSNLFVLTPAQLAVVTFLIIFSTWAVTQTTGLLFVGAAARFSLRFRQPERRNAKDWDVDPPPNRFGTLLASERRRAYLVPIVLGFPMVTVSFIQSPYPWLHKLTAILAGAIVAVVARESILLLGRRLRAWFYEDQTAVPASRALRVRQWIRIGGYRFSETLVGRVLTRPFSPGYSTLSEPSKTGTPAQEARLPFSHWRAAMLLVFVVVVYAAGAPLLAPDRVSSISEWTPALAYVLLVLTMIGLFAAALTFFFDSYRVPLLAVLAVLLFASYRYSDLDHYYDFSTAAYADERTLPRPPTSTEVLDGWSGRYSAATHPVMVVVAVSGGGSHAARWTAEVLTRLREHEAGVRFFESAAFFSLVSGGGLGAMYAIDAYNGTPPDVERLRLATEAASRSNVRALAWGLAYPDLVRKLAPWAFDSTGERWWTFDARRDRGWAVEQGWGAAREEPSRVATLASWAEDARRGIRPGVVFNATAMETGRRLLVSRVLIPGSTAHEFARLYPSQDLSVVTAVRLSSAFPYLLPMARPRLRSSPDTAPAGFEETAFHVADGGYYDNSGLLTAIEFLDSVLPRYRMTGRRRVLIVQILTALDDPAAAGQQNWLSGLAMPPSTALRVSKASQAARGDFELRLLAERWHNADLPADRRVLVEHVVFRLRDTGTLPWHLSDSEKASISGSWLEPENQGALRRLVAALAPSP